MAQIKNKFIFFDTLEKFTNRLLANEIPPTSITFVNEVEVKNAGLANEETVIKHSFIYTQGQYWYTTLSEDTQDVVAKIETLEDLVNAGYIKYNEVQQTYLPNSETLINGQKTNELPVSAKAVKAAIDAIGTNTDQGATGQAIINVRQTNGVVTATPGDIAASHVTYTPNPTTPETTMTNVQGAISEIYGKVEEGKLSVRHSNGSSIVPVANGVISVDGSDYFIYQGETKIATINVPKDMFLRSGKVVYGTYNSETETFTPAPAADDQSNAYVKLVIDDDTTDGNENAIYIPAAELVTEYSGSETTTITVSVTNHQISATLRNGSVTWNHLATSLQNKISAQKTTITTIDQTNPASKHILVSKTAGNESNGTGDNYTISEYDIASADEVASIPRIQSKSTGMVHVIIGSGNNPSATIDDSKIGSLPEGTSADKTLVQWVQDSIDAMGGENLWEKGTSNGNPVNSVKTKYAGAATAANGAFSISAGDHTQTNNQGEAAFGSYNISSSGNTDVEKTMFSVGIGDNSESLNGLEVRKDGSIILRIDKGSINGPEPSRLQDELEWYIG